MIRIKCSQKHYPNLLWQWLAIKDVYGRSGLTELTQYDIYFVDSSKPADIGISWHGDKVEGVPRNRCILLKTEPPIYNVAYGWNLCNPKYMDNFMAVLSLYKENYNNSYHFMYPCVSLLFKYINTHFDIPKDDMICMVLRNKKLLHRINSIVPKLRKYNKYSNYNFKVKTDRKLCDYLGHNNYHSYGRGWDKRCFKGNLKNREDIYKIFATHTFTFCPENFCFPGFITEKPMQAMFCGSIPLYRGPPDVHQYLPSETFVNLRANAFENYDEFITFLKELSEPEIEWYRDHIYNFVTSKRAIDMFSSVQLGARIIDILNEFEVY